MCSETSPGISQDPLGGAGARTRASPVQDKCLRAVLLTQPHGGDFGQETQPRRAVSAARPAPRFSVLWGVSGASCLPVGSWPRHPERKPLSLAPCCVCSGNGDFFAGTSRFWRGAPFAPGQGRHPQPQKAEEARRPAPPPQLWGDLIASHLLFPWQSLCPVARGTRRALRELLREFWGAAEKTASGLFSGCGVRRGL